MINNRFIRFLVNLAVMFALFLILGLFDIQPFLYAFLFSLPIWFVFSIQKDLLGDPDSKFFVLIKNIFIIAINVPPVK